MTTYFELFGAMTDERAGDAGDRSPSRTTPERRRAPDVGPARSASAAGPRADRPRRDRGRDGVLFAVVGVAAIVGGECILAAMGLVGCMMTLVVGGITLVRG